MRYEYEVIKEQKIKKEKTKPILKTIYVIKRVEYGFFGRSNWEWNIYDDKDNRLEFKTRKQAQKYCDEYVKLKRLLVIGK